MTYFSHGLHPSHARISELLPPCGMKGVTSDSGVPFADNRSNRFLIYALQKGSSIISPSRHVEDNTTAASVLCTSQRSQNKEIGSNCCDSTGVLRRRFSVWLTGVHRTPSTSKKMTFIPTISLLPVKSTRMISMYYGVIAYKARGNLSPILL